MNQTLYYKIITGFNAEDYIEINQEELEKAYYCFLTKKDAVFSGGAVRGSKIDMIKPDYHRIMGWNRGYKLAQEDFNDLAQKGIDRKTQLLLSDTQQRVQYLIGSKQENLIGKNIALPKPNKEVSALTSALADKMRV